MKKIKNTYQLMLLCILSVCIFACNNEANEPSDTNNGLPLSDEELQRKIDSNELNCAKINLNHYHMDTTNLNALNFDLYFFSKQQLISQAQQSLFDKTPFIRKYINGREYTQITRGLWTMKEDGYFVFGPVRDTTKYKLTTSPGDAFDINFSN